MRARSNYGDVDRCPRWSEAFQRIVIVRNACKAAPHADFRRGLKTVPRPEYPRRRAVNGNKYC